MINTIAAAKKYLMKENKLWPKFPRLVEIPREDWPSDRDEARMTVYRCKEYLVQTFKEQNGFRLSVNKTMIAPSGRWEDGLTWDELQAIKAAAGFEGSWAIEVYPPRGREVNVANMRHLWVLEGQPPMGWKLSAEKPA